MPALRERLTQYLRGRTRALGVLVTLGLAAHACGSRPREAGVSGLASWLGEHAEASVGVSDFVWGPQGGWFADLAWGRPIWFLAAAEPGAARDVYRARVRLAPTGRPLALAGVVNVTATPAADEGGLVLQAGRVAFGSVSHGLVHAVTVLDEHGARGGWLARLVARATTGAALARTDLVLEVKASTAALSLGERDVRLELADTAQSLVYDLERRTVEGSSGGIARALSRPSGEGSPRLEMLALSRAWLGLRATAWVGRALLSVEDAGRRLLAWSAPSAGSAPAAGAPHYQPVTHAWLKPPLGTERSASAPERYLFRATLHPDPRRPRSKLELVALDMRQLELGFEAGSRWPHPTLGAGGDGRLPEDPEHFRRVVAVFNAGPEAAYDSYGTLSSGRLLVAPEAGRPSVSITRGQRALLGPWTHGADIPADVLAFTQRRSALVHAGSAVPSTDASVRRRSALCATTDGRLVYAYAEALDATTLASALQHAGCEEALPLAGSPEQLGFVLADVTQREQGRFEPLLPGMDFDAAATLAGSTRDFFYVSVRDVTPKLPQGVSWKPDGGTQPAPTWLPGIVAGELRLGGITLALTSFAGGRFDFRVRPGPLEVGARGQAWAGALSAEDAARAVASLELGHATSATRYGLALGSVIPLPLRPTNATLVVGSTSTRILLPGEAVTLAAGEHAVQLPLLADDSDVTERARERGDARLRGALGVTEDGRVVVATLRHDSSDPLAVGLRAAGCRRVVELDRGSHHPASLERQGTDRPPREQPQSTTLWVLAPK